MSLLLDKAELISALSFSLSPSLDVTQFDFLEQFLFLCHLLFLFKVYTIFQCTISLFQFPYRLVGELVEYYYSWKKTERFVFFNFFYKIILFPNSFLLLRNVSHFTFLRILQSDIIKFQINKKTENYNFHYILLSFPDTTPTVDVNNNRKPPIRSLLCKLCPHPTLRWISVTLPTVFPPLSNSRQPSDSYDDVIPYVFKLYGTPFLVCSSLLYSYNLHWYLTSTHCCCFSSSPLFPLIDRYANLYNTESHKLFTIFSSYYDKQRALIDRLGALSRGREE